ncbi:MAG: 1-(5-phosphoribosyl)-5-[(5-phosphoribosylamino)methylideneamino]imidazole-4-carboxamide isomerase [Oscillospiraceae bacterium]|jgi:phosphoribosylformimino-5-aminoimidazole carboxamide ribotide isomerase|nr:1-(5-phosphoribosyl)-5-[(5-phosphoribosylamino)methylideneamino]imidazole-4-carboxamide isomerase [Oscillospiraceae bacterium]
MMILPAIDLKDGKCVRLIKGDFSTQHTVSDDPVRVAAQYRADGASWVHVVDLDGALDGKRRNAALVAAIVKAAHPAKVELGGGLRTEEDIEEADSLGVYRFVLGSAAVENPGLVARTVTRYGARRVAVGVDALDGMVKTRGWREGTNLTDTELAAGLADLGVKTLIYTDIATDGVLSGPSLERLAQIRDAFGGEVIASGGVSSVADVTALRRLRMGGCIIGKALYAGNITVRDAVFAGQWELCFVKNELIPAVVQDADTREVLMLGFMNREALRKTLDTGLVTFHSRSRDALWTKGETSGNYLNLKSISPDCDRDTLLIMAKPSGPTCHTGNTSCFFDTWEVR